MKRRQRPGGCSHKPRPPGMLETTRGQKRQGGPSPEPVERGGACRTWISDFRPPEPREDAFLWL